MIISVDSVSGWNITYDWLILKLAATTVMDALQDYSRVFSNVRDIMADNSMKRTIVICYNRDSSLAPHHCQIKTIGKCQNTIGSKTWFDNISPGFLSDSNMGPGRINPLIYYIYLHYLCLCVHSLVTVINNLFTFYPSPFNPLLSSESFQFVQIYIFGEGHFHATYMYLWSACCKSPSTLLTLTYIQTIVRHCVYIHVHVYLKRVVAVHIGE